MRLFSFVLGLFFCFFLVSFSPKKTVTFQSGSWSDLKERSLTENKFYFVEFDASYCASCRKMDNTTFTDKELVAFMNEQVLSKRIDIQDFDGFKWSQQYEVSALPTMLIFDRKGQLKKRIVGYQSAEQLLDQFRTIDQAQSRRHTPQPVASDQPMIKQQKTVAKKTVKSFQEDKWLTDGKTARGNGLYEVDIQKKATDGYTVQVGVFSSYEGTLNQADLMSRKYSKKLFIHIDTHNGSTVYKLLLGRFDTKELALSFRNDLRKDQTDGLIKDLSLLK